MTTPTAKIPTPFEGLDRRFTPRQNSDRRENSRTVEFCGARFDCLTPLQALERCAALTTQDRFRYIVTPNVDHVVRLHKEPEIYRPLYEDAWLSVCDSRILELLANRSGLPIKAVPGSDLSEQLMENEILPHEPLNIIGADETVIQRLKARYGLININHHQPPMGLRHKPEAVAEAAAFIAAHPARFSFICVGSPQQEMVAKAALAHKNAVGLGLCVGASLDFLAGQQKRAPKWMQRARLEWLYRLLKEPKRMWRRYLVEGPRIFKIWSRWKKMQ